MISRVLFKNYKYAQKKNTGRYFTQIEEIVLQEIKSWGDFSLVFWFWGLVFFFAFFKLSVKSITF